MTFRGSVTITDWCVDADAFVTRIANPLEGCHTSIKQGTHIGIHHGFYNYLFSTRGQNTHKYDVILGHLLQLLETHPGFNIHVTGHSLGGKFQKIVK